MAVTLGNTMGALFLGTVFASMLYGVMNLQVYLYYQHYPNDARILKISVALIWFLDTLHTSFTIAAVYHYLIDSFGVFKALKMIVWTCKLQFSMSIIIILVVQTLYAVRVWRLGQLYQRIWPAIVAVIVTIGYAIGIAIAVKASTISRFDELPQISWIIYAALGWTTVTDIAIATAICFYLIKNKSGFSRTNNMIVTIIRMTLISGFFTSACSLLAVITYAVMPDNLVFFGIDFLLTKLYINSFLAMLNARQNIRDRNTSSGNSFSMTKIMNIHTTISSLVATSGPVDVDADELPPLNEYGHGLDSGVGLEEVKRSGDLNRNHPIIEDRPTPPPRMQHGDNSV